MRHYDIELVSSQIGGGIGAPGDQTAQNEASSTNIVLEQKRGILAVSQQNQTEKRTPGRFLGAGSNLPSS